MSKKIFNTISIIGLGLIGSSLARKLKQENAVTTIKSYSKSSSTSNEGLKLGIIDKACDNIKEAVSDTDIVIICTPLTAYENIFKEIAVFANKETIITDVGSIKKYTIDVANKTLPKEMQQLFVPAHPIAGTEKTGVNAGFAELFIDKKLILTPVENSKQTAIKQVSDMWRICGANVEVLDPDQHDIIYAQLSHVVQLIAYCYMHYLDKIDDKKIVKNEDFVSFIRLCSSAPAIWLDIFKLNKDNIIKCACKIIELLKDFNSLMHNIDIKGKKTHMVCCVTTQLIPKIIARAIYMQAENKDYAGSGFKAMTLCLANFNKNDLEFIKENSDQIKVNLDLFIKEITEITDLIKNDKINQLHEYINKCNELVKKC